MMRVFDTVTVYIASLETTVETVQETYSIFEILGKQFTPSDGSINREDLQGKQPDEEQ